MLEQRHPWSGWGRPFVVASALAAVVGVATAGVDQVERRELPAFGMVGLAKGQVAVLNLVDVGAAGRDACRLTAAFVDASGQVFLDGAGNPVQKAFVLRPNVAAALQLRAEDILGNPQTRRSTRAVLIPPDDDQPSDCTCLMANREIVNADGKTSIDVYGMRPGGGGNPPPPPTCVQSVSGAR